MDGCGCRQVSECHWYGIPPQRSANVKRPTPAKEAGVGHPRFKVSCKLARRAGTRRPKIDGEITVIPPSLYFCKVAETKGLQNNCLQSSTNKGLTGKVAQTLELAALVTVVVCENPRLQKPFAWPFIFNRLRIKSLQPIDKYGSYTYPILPLDLGGQIRAFAGPFCHTSHTSIPQFVILIIQVLMMVVRG